MNNMTLHEAMLTILNEQPNKTMHRKDLADEIMKRKLYEKGDKLAIAPNQISARASGYPELFNVKDGYVSLK